MALEFPEAKVHYLNLSVRAGGKGGAESSRSSRTANPAERLSSVDVRRCGSFPLKDTVPKPYLRRRATSRKGGVDVVTVVTVKGVRAIG